MPLDNEVRKEICEIKVYEAWGRTDNLFYNSIINNYPCKEKCDGFNTNCKFHPQYQSK